MKRWWCRKQLVVLPWVVRGATSRSAAPDRRQGWGVIDEGDIEGQAVVQRVADSYGEAQARALHRLSQPIPEPSFDESAPDFVVGFNEYKFRSRDAYRTALCHVMRDQMDIPRLEPRHVHLSIAWHGRLPDQFMSGLQKAAGVTLDNELGLDTEKRLHVASRMIHKINEKKQVSLLHLGFVKAAPGSSVTRKANQGEVDISPKSIVKALTSHRAAVCLCTTEEMEWVLQNVVARARSARVDVDVVCLDDVNPAHQLIEAQHSLAEYVASCAAKRKPVRAIDGAVIPTTHNTQVTIRDLLGGVTPVLCLHGVAAGIGSFGITKLMRQNARLHAMVYRPDNISMRESRTL